MIRFLVSLVAVSACTVLGGAAAAQTSQPITSRDVVGSWSLVMTPAQRDDMTITIESRSGRQQVDFPLTITAQPNGRLSCVSGGDTLGCRIRNGGLVVSFAEGGARMTFTLATRTRTGFSGNAEMNVRFLPIGGTIGTVTMIRR